LARFNDAVARPVAGRAGMVARPASQTRIFTAHQWRGCIATMRGGVLLARGSTQPPANVAATVEPAFEDEGVRGEINRHWFGPMIPKVVNQAEAEKLHRFAVRAHSILACVEYDGEQRPNGAMRSSMRCFGREHNRNDTACLMRCAAAVVDRSG
jgi:hypothetical protein